MEALFPDNTPTVTRARAARAVVGSRDQLQIFFGGEKRDLNIAVATEVANKLAEMKEDVHSVELRRDAATSRTRCSAWPRGHPKSRREVAETIKQAVAVWGSISI